MSDFLCLLGASSLTSGVTESAGFSMFWKFWSFILMNSPCPSWLRSPRLQKAQTFPGLKWNNYTWKCDLGWKKPFWKFREINVNIWSLHQKQSFSKIKTLPIPYQNSFCHSFKLLLRFQLPAKSVMKQINSHIGWF